MSGAANSFSSFHLLIRYGDFPKENFVFQSILSFLSLLNLTSG